MATIFDVVIAGGLIVGGYFLLTSGALDNLGGGDVGGDVGGDTGGDVVGGDTTGEVTGDVTTEDPIKEGKVDGGIKITGGDTVGGTTTKISKTGSSKCVKLSDKCVICPNKYIYWVDTCKGKRVIVTANMSNNMSMSVSKACGIVSKKFTQVCNTGTTTGGNTTTRKCTCPYGKINPILQGKSCTEACCRLYGNSKCASKNAFLNSKNQCQCCGYQSKCSKDCFTLGNKRYGAGMYKTSPKQESCTSCKCHFSNIIKCGTDAGCSRDCKKLGDKRYGAGKYTMASNQESCRSCKCNFKKITPKCKYTRSSCISTCKSIGNKRYGAGNFYTNVKSSCNSCLCNFGRAGAAQISTPNISAAVQVQAYRYSDDYNIPYAYMTKTSNAVMDSPISGFGA